MLKPVDGLSDGFAFDKGLLGRNTKTSVFLAPSIMFIGQLEKDIELCLCIAQYLSPVDQ